METPIYFKDIERIDYIRNMLKDHVPVCVAFCANGYKHSLLLVPDENPVHIGFGDHTYGGHDAGEMTYVGLFKEDGSGGLYPLSLGNVSPSYVRSRLNINSLYNAYDITAFLNMLGYPGTPEHYLTTIPFDGDHVDYDKILS